jgi:glycosyltransferase involved in cell wall biosynthesis
LTIGGEGAERKKFEGLIEQYGLVGKIKMTGFIPTELLASYYWAADFFIFPTRQLEGFGFVTPEPLSCGDPVHSGLQRALIHFPGNISTRTYYIFIRRNSIEKGAYYRDNRSGWKLPG